ncbi:MAG: FAD-binding oxidoreductase [Chloroflexi bacterium]|nr:MAG: FAD-binding oxidoreductase [Chloroflexota bacterium]
MKQTFDVIVVGAGYIGCSAAYHLCKAGLKTALVEQGPPAAGASRANYGNIQIQDMELEKSSDMIQLARTRFAHLEEELGNKVGLRQISGLLTIETESQWKLMETRRSTVSTCGIFSELIPAEHLREVEPLIDPSGLLGALYHAHEGQVDPFKLIWSYLVAARRLGLQEYYQTPVTGFALNSGRIEGVQTSQGFLSAGCIVLCSGAYTAQLGQMLGCEWDIHYILGQALVTEPFDLLLRSHIASASFFEPAENEEPGTVRANFAISQSPHGHLLMGEAMYEAYHFKRHVPFQSLSSVSASVTNYFPVFSKLRILRSWSAPVAHTADSCPLLGPSSRYQGLFLAAGFRSTVIVTPLIGETVAGLVTRGKLEFDISNFLPERNNYAH